MHIIFKLNFWGTSAILVLSLIKLRTIKWNWSSSYKKMTFALTNEYLWRKYWRKTMISSSVHNTGPNVFIYNMILLKKCNVMLFIIENMKALRIVIFNISFWHNLNMLQILLLKELKIKKQNLLVLLILRLIK